MAGTRHLIGYLCCLAFVTLALTFFGFFPTVVKNVEANAETYLNGLRYDPNFGPLVSFTAHVFGASFSPALAIGHLVAIVVSPIGLFTLLLYALITWMLPAR